MLADKTFEEELHPNMSFRCGDKVVAKNLVKNYPKCFDEETTSIEKAIERKKTTEKSPFFAFYSLFCPIVFSLYGMCVSAISSGLIP